MADMFDVKKIRAISLDLDDTLWPIWPTIERAEQALHDWLGIHAPMAAPLFASPGALREIRNDIGANRPDLKNDVSAIRRDRADANAYWVWMTCDNLRTAASNGLAAAEQFL